MPFGARILTAVCAAALLAACLWDGPTQARGGSGTETTDGQIVALTGAPAQARVRLVPVEWNPFANRVFPDSLAAETDAAGKYSFATPAPGNYHLESEDAAGMRLFRAGITLPVSGALGVDSLRNTGRHLLHWEGSHRGWLFMRGTTWLRRIQASESEADSLLLDSLPAGTLPPLLWAPTADDTVGKVISDSLRIKPDSTSESSVFAAWAHMGVWGIDSAGPPSDASPAGFALLIRLPAPGFDFAEAAPDGSDLRFAFRGIEASHQIAMWDPASGRAEIWVRLPHLPDSGEAVRMYWGNAAAGSRSSGASVFRAADGYAAVWHLDETANTGPGGYRDATAFGLHGTASALIEPVPTDGAIGNALKLDGSKRVSLADAPSLDPVEAVTATAWFNAASWAGGNRRIVQKGAGFTQYALAGFGADSVEWRVVVDGTPYSLRYPAPPLGEWHHLAGTYDGMRSTLFLDGSEVTAMDLAGSLGVSADSLEIGHAPAGPDNQYFQGVLDEITVSEVARSATWLRAAFLNQRPGSGWLRFTRER